MIPGAVTGTLVGFDRAGAPLVRLAAGAVHEQLTARTCVPLGRRDIGKEIVLVRADSDRAIVLGVLQPSTQPEVEPREAVVDGKTVVLSAQDTITLRCGEASITLNRHGKIVIRGVHVVTHAEGVNRIRGGSVQLN